MSKASDNVFPRFLVSEGGSTATPAAARVTVYAKSDGLLYSKDDAGVETLVSSGPGGVSEIVDIPTAETDPTLVLAPDGTGGVEFRAEAGGAGGGTLLLLDVKPVSPHASDDEFDDTTNMSGTVNGLDDKWTSPLTSAANQGITVSYPTPGWMTFEPTTAGTADTGKYVFGMRQAAPAGSFSVMAKLCEDGLRADDARTGIFVATVGGKAYVLGSLLKYSRAAQVNEVTNYSESADWSGSGGSETYEAFAWPGPSYYKLVYDAGADTLIAYTSYSGMFWSYLATYTGVTAQPDRMGLCLWTHTPNIVANDTFSCSWFRVTEP